VQANKGDYELSFASSFAFVQRALLLSAAAGSLTAATVTYNYTGNDFISTGTTPLTTSDFISASFTFAGPLADNLSLAEEDTSVQTWSMTDQVTSLSNANGGYLGPVLISTDADGDIINWEFVGFSADFAAVGSTEIEIYNTSTPDNAYNESVYVTGSCEDCMIPETQAVAIGPGSLTELTGSATPEPSTGVTMLLSGAVLLSIIRKSVQSGSVRACDEL
jgi:hypothetical protein